MLYNDVAENGLNMSPLPTPPVFHSFSSSSEGLWPFYVVLLLWHMTFVWAHVSRIRLTHLARATSSTRLLIAFWNRFQPLFQFHIINLSERNHQINKEFRAVPINPNVLLHRFLVLQNYYTSSSSEEFINLVYVILYFSDIDSKFLTATMMTDVGIFMICLHTKFPMPSSRGSLVTIIKPKAKGTFRTAAILLFYACEKVTSTEVGHYFLEVH